jgi:hypothetical protein
MKTKILSLLILSIALISCASATLVVKGYFLNDVHDVSETITAGESITLKAIFTSVDSITQKDVQLPTGVNSDGGTCTASNSGYTYTCIYSISSNTEGTYSIRVIGKDSAGRVDSDDLTLAVKPKITPINHAPIITSTPIYSVNEGNSYSYQLIASDADNDALTYTLTSHPSWLSISSTGLISGTAQSVSVDTGYSVIVSVSDGKTTTTQSYTLTVNNIVTPTDNHAPVIEPISNQKINENTHYTYQVEASDQDAGDSLSYDLTGPSWLSIDSNGLISGKAPFVTGNEKEHIIVTVSDGDYVVSEDYYLTVKDSGSSSSGCSGYTVTDYPSTTNTEIDTSTKGYGSVIATGTSKKQSDLIWFYLLLGVLGLGTLITGYALIRKIAKRY